jgi:hypothetical protein
MRWQTAAEARGREGFGRLEQANCYKAWLQAVWEGSDCKRCSGWLLPMQRARARCGIESALGRPLSGR